MVTRQARRPQAGTAAAYTDESGQKSSPRCNATCMLEAKTRLQRCQHIGAYVARIRAPPAPTVPEVEPAANMQTCKHANMQTCRRVRATKLSSRVLVAELHAAPLLVAACRAHSEHCRCAAATSALELLHNRGCSPLQLPQAAGARASPASSSTSRQRDKAWVMLAYVYTFLT